MTKNGTLSKKENDLLLRIAKQNSVEMKHRGDFKTRYNDSEDFIEISVWGLQQALEAAYKAGIETGGKAK